MTAHDVDIDYTAQNLEVLKSCVAGDKLIITAGTDEGDTEMLLVTYHDHTEEFIHVSMGGRKPWGITLKMVIVERPRQ